MQAINHALTGAVIGLTIEAPEIAIPIAITSHFALDAMPHYGPTVPDEVRLVRNRFVALLVADAILCLLLVFLLMIRRPQNWILAVLCACAAAAPDFWSLRRFIRYRAKQPYHPGRIARFHTKIQWFQRPIGWPVEVVWFCAMSMILSTLIH